MGFALCYARTEISMTINFDKALGIHDKALLLFERRTQLLAENISNADTPDYKARDIDFDKMLQQANAGQLQMKATQPGHMGYPQDTMSAQVQYRIPEQSSADGNTVDIQKEKAAFAENTVRYQTTLTILSRRLSGIANAFKGE